MGRDYTSDEEKFRRMRNDLCHLRERTLGQGSSISDDDLRRISPTLRRLLVQDDLGQTWRQLGFERQPEVCGPDIDKMLIKEDVEAKHVAKMIAGGLTQSGITICGLGACKAANRETGIGPDADEGFAVKSLMFAKTSDGSPPGQSDDQDIYSIWPLSQYLDSAGGVIWGEMISRRKILQFHANHLDGAHPIQNSTAEKQAEYDLIFQLQKAFFRPPSGVERDGLYLELLSICQSVASSLDVERMIHEIDSRDPG